MSKGTDLFKMTIEVYLNGRAEQDPLFAETLKKESKNIDDCITYILNQVKASGCQGFDDSEVYNMAVHYYDEDGIDIGKPIHGNVIVNHSVPPKKGKASKTSESVTTKVATPIKKAKPVIANQPSLF